MIIRPSQKLAKKIDVSALGILPPDANPFADWSANLFTADRTQYVIITNTPSLYSTVMYGKGASSDSQFLDRALGCLREFMCDDGQQFAYLRFVAPSSERVRFSKALNRSITGSMNDFIQQAKYLLVERRSLPL